MGSFVRIWGIRCVESYPSGSKNQAKKRKEYVRTMPEKGVVKVYFNQRDRMYGFIQPDSGGPDLFFHVADWRPVLSFGAEAMFDTLYLTPIKLQPSVGDKVLFERARSNDGRPKAAPWAYASQWERAEREIARRIPEKAGGSESEQAS